MFKSKLSEQQEQEVLALYKRVKVREIAARFGCSGATITRILNRHGAMRPRYATEHEKKIICKLSGKRTQRQIATFLGRSLSFVTFWQRRQGFRAHPKLNAKLENEIIRLYRSRPWGQARVGREINVSEKVVHAVLVRYNIPLHKTGGVPFQLPPEQFSKFRADVLSRKYFAIDLAEKYGITKAIALRLSKEILGVEKFYGGETYPPLSSPFPQRYDARLTAADYCRFLASIFPNGVPEKEV